MISESIDSIAGAVTPGGVLSQERLSFEVDDSAIGLR